MNSKNEITNYYVRIKQLTLKRTCLPQVIQRVEHKAFKYRHNGDILCNLGAHTITVNTQTMTNKK